MAACIGLPVHIRKLFTDTNPTLAHVMAIGAVLLAGYTLRKTVLGGFDAGIILEQFSIDGMAVAVFSLAAASPLGRSLLQKALGTVLGKRHSLLISIYVAAYFLFWGHLTTALFEALRKTAPGESWEERMNGYHVVDNYGFPVGIVLSALLLIAPALWPYLKDLLLALWQFLVKTLLILVLAAGALLLIHVSIKVADLAFFLIW